MHCLSQAQIPLDNLYVIQQRQPFPTTAGLLFLEAVQLPGLFPQGTDFWKQGGGRKLSAVECLPHGLLQGLEDITEARGEPSKTVKLDPVS